MKTTIALMLVIFVGNAFALPSTREAVDKCKSESLGDVRLTTKTAASASKVASVTTKSHSGKR